MCWKPQELSLTATMLCSPMFCKITVNGEIQALAEPLMSWDSVVLVLHSAVEWDQQTLLGGGRELPRAIAMGWESRGGH